MNGQRFAGAVVFCLWATAYVLSPVALRASLDDSVARPDEAAPLFRVFLKDGSSLASYGELARVADRVVFSLPTTGAADESALHLVDLPADRVDWERTTSYAESARASQYVRTRADSDYSRLTTDLLQALNDVAQTPDLAMRLQIVQRARKTLADWPPTHYNFKTEDVRQMLGILDEAIAELRATTGAQKFDLSLVTVFAPPMPAFEALLPPPTLQEAIDQTLAASRLTDSPSERTSLLTVALGTIERRRSELPADWALSTHAAAAATLESELAIDRSYRLLSAQVVGQATARAREADVRGVQRVLAQITARDTALGASRPDTVNSIVATVESQLDAARRLRLERDRWAMRLPELRQYRAAVASALARLDELRPALEDIKALTGSGPDAIGAILRGAAAVQAIAAGVVPPDELRETHGLLLSAAQFADSAARTRREAAIRGDMERAWNASSAAAGALMLGARARIDMQVALRAPQLPR